MDKRTKNRLAEHTKDGCALMALPEHMSINPDIPRDWLFCVCACSWMGWLDL